MLTAKWWQALRSTGRRVSLLGVTLLGVGVLVSLIVIAIMRQLCDRFRPARSLDLCIRGRRRSTSVDVGGHPPDGQGQSTMEDTVSNRRRRSSTSAAARTSFKRCAEAVLVP